MPLGMFQQHAAEYPLGDWVLLRPGWKSNISGVAKVDLLENMYFVINRDPAICVRVWKWNLHFVSQRIRP